MKHKDGAETPIFSTVIARQRIRAAAIITLLLLIMTFFLAWLRG